MTIWVGLLLVGGTTGMNVKQIIVAGPTRCGNSRASDILKWREAQTHVFFPFNICDG